MSRFTSQVSSAPLTIIFPDFFEATCSFGPSTTLTRSASWRMSALVSGSRTSGQRQLAYRGLVGSARRDSPFCCSFASIKRASFMVTSSPPTRRPVDFSTVNRTWDPVPSSRGRFDRFRRVVSVVPPPTSTTRVRNSYSSSPVAILAELTPCANAAAVGSLSV